MAKVKEVSVNYARAINLGNYESMRIEQGEIITLDAKDEASKVRAEHFAKVKADVTALVKDVKEKQKAGAK